uniref:MSP domain-containing protein n=1 Tax=Trichogramma kaykai TaxID=54128 RepID=A0ABD2XEA1_9HYME
MEEPAELCDLQINLDIVDIECNFPPIDFGSIGVGCKKTAQITVYGPASPTYTMYTYSFELRNTSEIDSVFEFEGSNKGTLEVGVEDTKTMKIHFKPDLPHRLYSSLLWISVHEGSKPIKSNHIFITGSSRGNTVLTIHIQSHALFNRFVGSRVTADFNKLIFVLKNSCEPRVKYLKLTNASNEESDFTIENHCEHSAFKIEPKFGNVTPRETVELTIEFRQDKTGMNKCILPILFSKQASYRTCELLHRY